MVQRVASGQADDVVHGSNPAARVTRLSQGQIDCLLLVDQHHSSKEIAVRLGISPHTVDQRIRGALEKLGVDRRGEAARLVESARAELASDVRRARQDLRQEVSELAITVAERLIRKSLHDEDHRRIVADAIARVDKAN